MSNWKATAIGLAAYGSCVLLALVIWSTFWSHR